MCVRRVEVLVAGGGPAGATIGRLLALKGRQVLLVDPQTTRMPRLDVLAPAALGVVEAVGISQLLDDSTIARRCLGIQRRWGRATTDTEDFLSHPRGKGFIVDRSLFDSQLLLAAEQVGVEVHRGRVAGVECVRAKAGSFTIVITGRELPVVIVADVVIDATGRPAALSRRLGARQVRQDRRIAELLSQEISSDQEWAPGWLHVARDYEGWTYRLSGPGGYSQHWRITRNPPLLPQMASRFLDASTRRMSHVGSRGWLAVGDATGSFDPITSQGLFHAFSTALVATGILESKAGCTVSAAQDYTAAIQATVELSDRVRRSVYAGI